MASIYAAQLVLETLEGLASPKTKLELLRTNLYENVDSRPVRNPNVQKTLPSAAARVALPTSSSLSRSSPGFDSRRSSLLSATPTPTRTSTAICERTSLGPPCQNANRPRIRKSSTKDATTRGTYVNDGTYTAGGVWTSYRPGGNEPGQDPLLADEPPCYSRNREMASKPGWHTPEQKTSH